MQLVRDSTSLCLGHDRREWLLIKVYSVVPAMVGG